MSFLDDLSKSDIENGVFPLQSILKDSLYYPSSGFDGSVIQYCNTTGREELNISSFIYCDFAKNEEDYNNNIDTFKGYHIFAERTLTEKDLIPNGWIPDIPPDTNINQYTRWKHIWRNFFTWTVFERNENYDNSHGPKRFSLLYLGGEGVATYQAIYWTNKQFPKAITIIRPGTGFGYNWTDFYDGRKHLSWVVNNNKYGKPKYIFAEGQLLWDSYHHSNNLRPIKYGNLRIRIYEYSDKEN